jgi:hypothetical protein
MIRTQLNSWLFAAGFCFAATLSGLARAADPDPAALPTVSSRAERDDVNPSEVNSLPPAPPRLMLTEPSVRPITTSSGRRNEVNVFGLRIPTLIAFGLSGLSAGGAVATNLMARHGNDPSSCDSCNEQGGARRGMLLVSSGILTGLAAVGVGVGITFMIKAPKDPTRDAIRPRFDVGLSGEKAVAKVGWNFRSL